jgi:transcriptional regulator with XRE-family HTH domain
MFNMRQYDIAKELNIWRVTVSKALRNHPDISAQTLIYEINNKPVMIFIEEEFL